MPRQPSGPLRLLIVVNVFHPDQLGGAVIFTDLAKGLSERGIDVKVHCAYPYYPEWEDKSGENGWKILRESHLGIPLERFGLYIPSKPNSLLQRLLYEFSFFLSLSRRVRVAKQYDALMVFCPLMGSVMFGRLAKLLYRKPLWLNVQDLPAQAATAGDIGSSRSASIFRWIQKRLFSGFDLWSSISPVMIEQLERDNKRNRRILNIPNYVHDSLATLTEASREAKTAPSSRPVNLFYSGNIGSKQDLLLFCQYLQKSDESFVFKINGNGSGAPEIQKWIETVDDNRFLMGGFLSEDLFVDELYSADYCVVSEKSGSGGSFIPSKIIPAMACDCPVLAISDLDSPLGKEMSDHKIGPHFEWTQLDSRLSEMFELLRDETHYQKLLDNCRTRSQFYSRDNIIDTYHKHLIDLTKHGDI